jgi:hypothetical protein
VRERGGGGGGLKLKGFKTSFMNGDNRIISNGKTFIPCFMKFSVYVLSVGTDITLEEFPILKSD